MEQACAFDQSALQVLDQAVELDARNRSLRFERIDVLNKLGEIALRQRRVTPARGYYAKAAAEVETLMKRYPNHAPVRTRWANTSYGLATALNEESMHDKGVELFRKLIAFYDGRIKADSGDTNAQFVRMLCLARAGDHRAAAAVADVIGKEWPTNASAFFQIACGYGLCAGAVSRGGQEDRSLKEQYTGLSLAALQRARELGYRNWVLAATEPDLAPVLDLPEFKALLDAALVQPRPQ
jgi:hypothetical protein